MSRNKESLPTTTTISILAPISSTEPRAIKTTNIKLNSDSRPSDVVKTGTVTLTHKQRGTKKKKSPSTTDNTLKLEITTTTKSATATTTARVTTSGTTSTLEKTFSSTSVNPGEETPTESGLNMIVSEQLQEEAVTRESGARWIISF